MKPKSSSRLAMALMIAVAFNVHAQNFLEISIGDGIGSSSKGINIDGKWVVPLNSGDCQADRLVMVNPDGKYHYLSLQDNIMPAFDIHDIITDGTGNLIFAGFAGKNNDVGTYFNAWMCKMDTSGNLKWQVRFGPSEPHGFISNHWFTRVVQLDDSNFYAVSAGDDFAKVEKNSRICWLKKSAGIMDISGIGNKLIAASGNHIQVLDTSGSVINDYTYGSGVSFIKIERNTNGYVMAFTTNKVYLINSSFQVTDSFAIPSYIYNKYTSNVHFAVSNSSYVISIDNQVYSYDLNGNLTWNLKYPPGYSIAGLCLNGNRIGITGSTGNSNIFFKTYDLNGNTDPFKNNVTIEKIIPVHYGIILRDATHNIYDVSAYYDVTIKNNGVITLDSLYLESFGMYSGQWYNCTENMTKKIQGLGLAPGNSTILNGINIYRYAGYGNPGAKINFTLAAVAPNGKLDSNPSDDTLSFRGIITGIKTAQDNRPDLRLYPNPARDEIFIENPAEPGSSVNVSDITGKILMSQKIQQGQNIVKIDQLRPGIYFVVIHSESGSVTQKLIKE
jgi:hypothetical protein